MSTSEARTRVVGGRYRLDHAIGSGGMGTVWHGVDDLLGREVAVKEVRFPPTTSDRERADLRERTLREARATARVSHPNIVTTYDVVEDDGRPYIVMELLPNRSLSTVLREDGPMPPDRVARLGLELLSALETSHGQGVVHRDVKPGNVLLRDGRAVLTDFGIALTDGDPALTSTGIVLGSPSYMSPERARGRKPGATSDLWSLGATLYAAVEGRPPFDADTSLGTLIAVISDPVEPPTTGGPLGEAILGLLEKDPDRRMGIPAARSLLERAAADRSPAATAAPAVTAATAATAAMAASPATPAPLVTRDDDSTYGARRPPRVPLVAGLVVVALLVIGALVGYALVGDGGSGDPSAQDSSPKPSATPSTSAEPAPEPTPPADGAPEGFTTYTDPTGFTVAVPDGWLAESSSATAVDLTDPSGTRFLRIDQTSSPGDDPKADWKRQEKAVKDRLDSYKRVGIEDVDYNGWPAADWEFTFGTSTHVVDRGFVPSEDRGYALYMSSPEDQWAESLQIFQTAADTFVPAAQ